MALKKSQLYSSLWSSCDELRGGMDASQYKDYVLVLLFVKYVSDKYAGKKDALLDVPKGGRFSDMVALKGDKEIGDKMNKIIGKLAEANDLKGVIDVADFNDADKLGKGKEMVDRLSNLVAIFDSPSLDFSGNRAEGDDLLGDAYEYLMRHFATESGKSKGQFYTPAEVSRVMAKVVGVGSAKSASQTIHDPTCGSGSLLLKAHDEAKGRTGLDLALYGQEMDNATSALARMNMILHDCPTAEIWKDNVLASPHFKSQNGALKTFDFVVANPPFSFKAWSNGFKPAEDEFKRFGFGVPPVKNGDLAFLLHILTCLKSTGKAAVNLPHGVLFRGNSEGAIRREIVRRGYVKGIIGLPTNLFYGTSIPACIVVLDKEHAHARKGVFMIDASRGFIKDGNKNRLRAQDIHRIVDTFTRQLEIPGYSRMVPLAEISDAKNDFNLNLPRYIDNPDPGDLQDIDAHLHGGIPERDLDALDRYWQVFPSVRSLLFGSAGRAAYSDLKLPIGEINAAIFGHSEFTAFNTSITSLFEKWKKKNGMALKGIKPTDHPKVLLDTLSENLLQVFRDARLLDSYDVYQHLMDYWAVTMQDDVYLLVQEGWKAVFDGKPNTDLIPPPLIIARYFTLDQEAVEKLEIERDAITRLMEELDEEHGGEEGLLAEVKSDKGKISAKSVKDRLKVIKADEDFGDEREMLNHYLGLLEQESEAGKKVKDAQKVLDAKVAAKYGVLTEGETKTLVIDDKWLASLGAAVQGELDRVSQALTRRIRELAERYATPLPELNIRVASLATRIDEHLKKMGAELVTGYRRLPGFHGQWEMKTLRDVCSSITDGTHFTPRYVDKGVPFFSVENVTANNFTDTKFISREAHNQLIKRCKPEKGDILLTRIGSLGETKLIDWDTEASIYVSLALLKIKECVDARFVYCYTKCRQFVLDVEARSLMNASPKKINMGDIGGVPIPVPELAEQRAIAAVLSDMDAEIEVLGQRRDKTRALKQGMMQELLMGRAR